LNQSKGSRQTRHRHSALQEVEENLVSSSVSAEPQFGQSITGRRPSVTGTGPSAVLVGGAMPCWRSRACSKPTWAA